MNANTGNGCGQKHKISASMGFLVVYVDEKSGWISGLAHKNVTIMGENIDLLLIMRAPTYTPQFLFQPGKILDMCIPNRILFPHALVIVIYFKVIPPRQGKFLKTLSKHTDLKPFITPFIILRPIKTKQQLLVGSTIHNHSSSSCISST
ncbi:hypothetical protein J6590_005164 [Homalodisca vitripennis]|nr:hypothetical protein J6590_005164 [Homalodisca vitripennis]